MVTTLIWKEEPFLNIAGERQIVKTTLERSLALYSKVKFMHTVWPSNSTRENLLCRNVCTCGPGDMNKKNSKLETIQKSIHNETDFVF